MSPSIPQKAALVATAGAAALGAFAIGSQLDDGTASAANSRSGAVVAASAPAIAVHAPFGHPGLADELGVSEQRLQDALESLRPAGERDDGLTAAIADELGVSAAKVEAAFEAAHEKLRDERLSEEAAALAPLLGVDAAKVKAALADLVPDLDAGPVRRVFDPAERLADALGIDEEKVDDAFEKLAEQRERELEAEREQFARDLAAKLGLSAEQVAEALEGSHPMHDHIRGAGPGFGGPGFRGPAFGGPAFGPGHP
ncbi:MAG TPA: hypothetical protein VIL49_01375 [Capillimicrobium sp.]|jgi:biotin operon repressor